RGTGITSLPEGLTVGGSLDLRGTGITSLPEGLTVGGSLDLRGTGITESNYRKLTEGDYKPGSYLYADGILTHVKCSKKVGENGKYTLYIGKIKGKNVVSDGTNYAHCRTLRDGIADLIFKSAADRGADQYKGLNLDSEVKTEDAIVMYRIITGACRQGTQNFIDSLKELKDSYTISEIIDLTKGNYGAEKFRDFFEN
ncbi:MAG: hypothetical protein IJ385_06275, partial [Ruminiclostridium sp.]|nr:hypothetical protein [Ruminiclostridium sp.]